MKMGNKIDLRNISALNRLLNKFVSLLHIILIAVYFEIRLKTYHTIYFSKDMKMAVCTA